MKERPILFTGAMVRALLDGSKTQTRRIAKEFVDHDDLDAILRRFPNQNGCPHGQPGDRLWVRETWLEDPEDDGTWHYTSYMGCKGSPLSDIPKRFQKPEHCLYRATWDGPDMRWRPSIHMPRWASRILLEITSARVERLQDISDQDAIAEGIGLNAGAAGVPMTFPNGETVPRAAFRCVWQSINGKESWDANPWVWVIEFKRVTP